MLARLTGEDAMRSLHPSNMPTVAPSPDEVRIAAPIDFSDLALLAAKHAKPFAEFSTSIITKKEPWGFIWRADYCEMDDAGVESKWRMIIWQMPDSRPTEGFVAMFHLLTNAERPLK